MLLSVNYIIQSFSFAAYQFAVHLT